MSDEAVAAELRRLFQRKCDELRIEFNALMARGQTVGTGEQMQTGTARSGDAIDLAKSFARLSEDLPRGWKLQSLDGYPLEARGTGFVVRAFKLSCCCPGCDKVFRDLGGQAVICSSCNLRVPIMHVETTEKEVTEYRPVKRDWGQR